MKKILFMIYAGISIILLAMSLYIYNLSRDYLNIKKSDFLGNTASIIDLLKKKEGKTPFSFAFISDTENSDNSIWLIKSLLEGDVDFLVCVGDFVDDSLVPEHKLFWYTISKLNPKIPIFVVPGNHDIEPQRNREEPNKFFKKNFQDLYGPLNFSFIYNNCLFVFICNIDQEDTESISYLESVLSRKRAEIKHVFVFCHTPLRKVLNKVLQCPVWVGDLDKIAERHKVDYVISGDYHKHLELTDNNNIQHIVSGSGGAHFAEDISFGRFQNGTKMTVYPDSVMQEIVVCSGKIRFTDNSIRRFMYNKFIPLIESRFWLVNTAVVLFIINALFSAYCFIRRIEI